MKLLKKIKVPTGEIYTAEGEKGTLEFLTVGDYGKQANIKAETMTLPDAMEMPEMKKL